jgi:hypothetical protein
MTGSEVRFFSAAPFFNITEESDRLAMAFAQVELGVKMC